MYAGVGQPAQAETTETEPHTPSCVQFTPYEVMIKDIDKDFIKSMNAFFSTHEKNKDIAYFAKQHWLPDSEKKYGFEICDLNTSTPIVTIFSCIINLVIENSDDCKNGKIILPSNKFSFFDKEDKMLKDDSYHTYDNKYRCHCHIKCDQAELPNFIAFLLKGYLFKKNHIIKFINQNQSD
jgi:hypothetical protein